VTELLQKFNDLDNFWVSVGPLIFINLFFLLSLFFFYLTYRFRKISEISQVVDEKEHSHLLSRFLKEYWYWLSSPFEKLLLKLRITPNALTMIGFLISCLSAYFFYRGRIGLGGWFMIFGATFDMFDGRIARLTGQSSPSGAFFDSVMDRFGEGVVFLGLVGYYRNSWLLYAVVIALIGSTMVSYTRARGEGIGVACTSGIMQRPERIVYLSLGSIFSPIAAYYISLVYVIRFDFLLVIAISTIALLSNVSAISRVKRIIKASRELQTSL
jgi:phosphatidylglycerophosphate synthase